MALTRKQLELRKQGIGGSDVAAILGLSKWATPRDIFFQKTSDEVIEQEETPFIEWGNRLEPLIIQKFMDDTGLEVKTTDEMFKHEKHKFMLANVDGLIPSENAILEVKTASAYMKNQWADEGGDNLPDYYLTQVAHYAEVLNVKKVYVAVLIGGNDFRIYHYNRSTSLGNLLIDKESDFWNNHVIPKIPPKPISEIDAAKMWQSVCERKAVTISEQLEAKVNELKEIKYQIKKLESLAENNTIEIMNFMKENDTLIDSQNNILATWKMQEVKRLDNKKLKNENSQLFDKYSKISQNRVFRLK